MNKRVRFSISVGVILILVFGPFGSLTAGLAGADRTGASGKRFRVVHPTPPNLIRSRSAQAGQTVTLLPDGRELIVGGEDASGPISTAKIKEQNSAPPVLLPFEARYPRAWHTTTVLPDGTALLFGGYGPDGRLVETAEVFNPDTFDFKPSPVNVASRAHHTATVLTDGRVLIAGGFDSTGSISRDLELWDPRTNTPAIVKVNPRRARTGHTATLLPSGGVLFSGGLDARGKPVRVDDIFDPVTNSLRAAVSPQSAENTLEVKASIPADRASDVPLDTLIAVRFSKRIDVKTFSRSTISVISSYGPLTASVSAAEAGMLGFIRIKPSLIPDASYSVSLSGVSDTEGNTLPVTTITFSTVSAQSLVPLADNDEEWIPNAENLRGNWRSNRPDSPFRALPSLQASPGVTALAGQALTLNGQPLEEATIRVQDKTTRTDRTGRFLLESIVPGRHTMVIDGRTGDRPGRMYGVFEVAIDVEGGYTNSLPYTIWMPKLDTAHSVTIPTPTTSEVVVTTPFIPGLELHIPPQTTIRDHEGQPVTQLSITPIPVDRTPFPLPEGVEVPVYFTIQPGGAYVKNYSGTGAGARLIYPNYRNELPNTRTNFWHYDPVDKGWYVYGKGKVGADGRQVIPDPGVSIYKFTGAMINTGNSPPGEGPSPGNNGEDGDPVDLGTGLFVLSDTDLILPDVMPLALTRTYRQNDSVSRLFGIGTTFSYDMFLFSALQYQEADLILPDGGRVHYVRISAGTGFTDAEFEHTGSPSIFVKSRIKWNGNGWDLTLKNGTVLVFGDEAPLHTIRNRHGNRIIISRAGTNGFGSPIGNITRVTSPNGRFIEFTYDSNNRITLARDSIGRTVNYAYDASGRLISVTDPKGGLTEYSYDTSHRMLTVEDARRIVFLTNQYDSNGRVIRQTQADGTTYQFAYTLDSSGNVTQTTVTDPRGNVRRVTFNSNGYMLTDVFPVGKPEQQTVTYEWSSAKQLAAVTDSLSRRTEFAYDDAGNVTGITRMAGTSQAVTASIGYDSRFAQIAALTDPMGHSTSFTYDDKGNLLSVTDPTGNRVTLSYNAAGQPVSVTDALSRTTTFSYDSGNLVSVTDPLGRTTSRFLDRAGRALALTNPLGHTTRYDYDANNRLTRITDPLGGITSFSYDANGNLLSVTDPRGNAVTYTYDDNDRMVSRRDALLRQETYQYDAIGNLVKVTDRRGKVTSYLYDGVNRRIFAGFGTTVKGQSTTHESTIDYRYDNGNRLTGVTDSIAGVVNFTYDSLDRLATEATPQGSVSYTYDADGKRTSLTVAGQSQLSYSYDNSHRLTQIAQGATTVSLGYDAVGRRSSTTLPGAVAVEYEYDAGSQLTGINYKRSGSLIGNLTYQYDSLGRRSSVGGGYSRLALSQPVSSSNYNAANQQLSFGSQNLSYDANGNLTSDGANTYTWDARNRLVSLTGPGTSATFQYDAFGRRTRKTVNGVTTDFLYDGRNTVQEIAGGSPSANLLSSLGIDEVFVRTDANGARTFLVDGLGSTLALLDSSGNTQTEYTYDAFGKTTSGGPVSSNPYQFTGRENDGTGLYYHRSRYYSPNLQRFISEDPIGLAGGLNVFGYVNNSPTNFRDPNGLFLDTIIDIISIGYDIYRLATDGRKNLGENLLSLGLDIGGALLPFATGLGAANRAASHADDVLKFADDAADATKGLCFAAGTKVMTEEGEKPIETLSPGDRVVSANPLEGRSSIRQVTRTFARTATAVLDVKIGSTTVTCTPEHPFWVEGEGWQPASLLSPGSPLRTRQGTIVQVSSVTRREGSFEVYNIEVNGLHTYFVSELGVLVHNTCREMTPDQQALKDLVDEVTNGGRKPLSVDDANTVLDWADEVQYPGARAKPGDVSSPSNWTGHPNQPPHIHLPGAGRGGHVPVQPGVQPRP